MSRIKKDERVPVCVKIPKRVRDSMRQEAARLGLSFTSYLISCHNRQMESSSK